MKRISFLLLFLIVMIFCCGCSSGAGGSSEDAAASDGSTQELVEYPASKLKASAIYGFAKTQDGYMCIGENSKGERVKLTAKTLDGGFEEETMYLGPSVTDADMLSAAYIEEDGGSYLALSSISEDRSVTSMIMHVLPSGVLKILAEGIEGNVKNIRMLDDGYIAGCSDGVIRRFSMEGDVLYTIDSGEYTDMCVAGDKIVVLNERNILTYNVSDGKAVDTITSFDEVMTDGLAETFNTKGMDALSCKNIMKYDDAEGKLYIMLSNGLFEYKLDDKLGIRLISFTDSDIAYDYAIEDKNTFVTIVGNQNGKKNMVVYSSDTKYAALDSEKNDTHKNVTLYSLYYMNSYENLITFFEGNHEDMSIDYIWGVDDENGISESDAISSLNTQLLAGEGPDVIIMDGLNVRSYEDTGVLMELSQVYDEIIQKNPDCLETVLNTYRRDDGTMYAIPSMESFIALVGHGDEIKDVKDVPALVDYIHSKDIPKQGNDLRFYYWQCFFDTLYPVYAADIVDINGNYDKDMLRKFLEDVKTLYDAEMERTTQEQIDEFAATYPPYEEIIKKSVNCLYMDYLFNREWSGQEMAFVNMRTVVEPRYVYSIIEDNYPGNEVNTINADYDYAIWGNGNGNVYMPNTILAINNKEENKATAIEFVVELFSPSSQEFYTGVDYGNPSNMDAVRLANEFALSVGTPGGGSGDLGGVVYSEWDYWRTDEFLEDYISKLRSLETPANPDVRVKNMIRDNVEDYMEGNMSLDDTFDAIDKLLEVYISE